MSNLNALRQQIEDGRCRADDDRGTHDHVEERLWCNARNGDDAADDL